MEFFSLSLGIIEKDTNTDRDDGNGFKIICAYIQYAF